VFLVRADGSWGHDRSGRFDDGAPMPTPVSGMHESRV
jgi:hypothetical protein